MPGFTVDREDTKLPYKSKAQQGYFHANKKKLEAQGVDISEWDRASKGKKLPKKAKAKKKKKR